MIRTITLAAAAALLVTVPANAASVRVSLAGKSADQIGADIAAAARTVCFKETAFETFRLYALNRCVKDTMKSTLDKLDNPQVSAAATQQLASR